MSRSQAFYRQHACSVPLFTVCVETTRRREVHSLPDQTSNVPLHMDPLFGPFPQSTPSSVSGHYILYWLRMTPRFLATPIVTDQQLQMTKQFNRDINTRNCFVIYLGYLGIY